MTRAHLALLISQEAPDLWCEAVIAKGCVSVKCPEQVSHLQSASRVPGKSQPASESPAAPLGEMLGPPARHCHRHYGCIQPPPAPGLSSSGWKEGMLVDTPVLMLLSPILGPHVAGPTLGGLAPGPP